MALEPNGSFVPDAPPASGPSTGTFSPQQVDAAVAALTKAGMDPAHIAKRLAEPAGDAPRVELKPDDRAGELNQARAEKMAAALRKAGVSQDRIKAAMEADGFTETSPAHSGAEYQLDWRRIAPDADLTGVVEVNALLTAGVAEMAMLPGMGKGIAERVVEVGQQVAKMTPTEKTLWQRTQAAELRRHFGSDEAVVAAAHEIDRLGEAGPAAARLLNIMQLNQSVRDAWTFRTLVNFARHVAETNNNKR